MQQPLILLLRNIGGGWPAFYFSLLLFSSFVVVDGIVYSDSTRITEIDFASRPPVLLI